MFVRRLLELSIFVFYWFGFGSFAITVIYHRWLIQELNVGDLVGKWTSLAIFVFILVIIYLILRRFTLYLYTKCEVSEKRLLANMKKEVRDLKRDQKNSTTPTSHFNLAFENERIGSRKKRKTHDEYNLKRGKSMGDITQPSGHSNDAMNMQNSRSLETVLNSQRRRNGSRRQLATISRRNSFQLKSTEELSGGYSPPPAYNAINKQFYESDDDEHEAYHHRRFNKNPPINNIKHGKSYDNILNDNSMNTMQASSASVDNIYKTIVKSNHDEIDGLNKTPKIFRRAPPIPDMQMQRTRSLPRQSNKTRNLQQSNTISSHVVEIHQPIQMQRTKVQRPDLV